MHRFLTVCLLLASVWCAVRLLTEFRPKIKETQNFVPTYYSSFGTSSPTVLEENDKKTSEMNNAVQNNAKNVCFDTVKENSDMKCESVSVLMKDRTVVEMPLEEYVLNCVLGEMPVSFESQALMAQCVAVRTFTVRQKLCGKSKHQNAVICTNPACCQSFANPKKINISEENLKKLCDAVNATKGMVMTYDGVPIEAVYHASSGKNTLDSEAVWGGRVEYLRSVKSPDGEEEIYAEGMGHRVGMSQHGANLLAKEGLGFASILKYYYRGIEFDFLI